MSKKDQKELLAIAKELDEAGDRLSELLSEITDVVKKFIEKGKIDLEDAEKLKKMYKKMDSIKAKVEGSANGIKEKSSSTHSSEKPEHQETGKNTDPSAEFLMLMGALLKWLDPDQGSYARNSSKNKLRRELTEAYLFYKRNRGLTEELTRKHASIGDSLIGSTISFEKGIKEMGIKGKSKKEREDKLKEFIRDTEIASNYREKGSKLRESRKEEFLNSKAEDELDMFKKSGFKEGKLKRLCSEYAKYHKQYIKVKRSHSGTKGAQAKWASSKKRKVEKS